MKRRGRPKGSRNKNKPITPADLKEIGEKIGQTIRIRLPNDFKITDTPLHIATKPTEPASFLSRLEAATIKYETAINDAISALKGN